MNWSITGFMIITTAYDAIVAPKFVVHDFGLVVGSALVNALLSLVTRALRRAEHGI